MDLKTLHRFAKSQLLYPLILSSMLAICILIGRIFLSHTFSFLYMTWNLALAWLPYWFSVLAVVLNRRYPRPWGAVLLLSALWLLFLPNAPYILTDFLHLGVHRSAPLWYDTSLLAAFSWTGLFLAVVSLRNMQDLVKEYTGWAASWVFVAVVAGLSGLGVYLGRFLRWNSWDLLVQPIKILEDIAIRLFNPLSNLGFFGFTMLMAAFLVVCYLMFISAHPLHELDETD